MENKYLFISDLNKNPVFVFYDLIKYHYIQIYSVQHGFYTQGLNFLQNNVPFLWSSHLTDAAVLKNTACIFTLGMFIFANCSLLLIFLNLV